MYVGGMTPIRSFQRPIVQAGGGVDAGSPPVALPQTVVPPQAIAPVQPDNQMTVSTFFASVASGIASMFKSVVAFFKNLFGGGAAETLDPQLAQYAQQYGLQATKANIQAFQAEINTYGPSGVLGPTTPNTQGVMELQTALGRLGYPVQATGQYDQATMAAVTNFKQANGLHQSYLQPNGQYAVNGYAELSTQTLIKARVTTPGASFQGAQATQAAPWDLPAAQRNNAAIAQAYGLLNAPDNLDAFCNEWKSYQTNGALGPSSPPSQAISDLQAALGRLNSPVSQTGAYDAATAQAVKAFKAANGLHQTYKDPNGNFIVNEIAESSTLGLMMQKLQAAQPAVSTQVAAPVQSAATQPAAPSAQVNAALAAQYHLLNTAANLQAFQNEIRQYAVDGALGPNSNQTQPIKDLQTVLQKWNFPVTPSGTYDAATAQAVMNFKTQNNLHQSYKNENGDDAVNEYADKQTLMFIMQKLQAEMSRAA